MWRRRGTEPRMRMRCCAGRQREWVWPARGRSGGRRRCGWLGRKLGQVASERQTDALCSQYGSRIVHIGWRWIVDEPCWDLEKHLFLTSGSAYYRVNNVSFSSPSFPSDVCTTCTHTRTKQQSVAFFIQSKRN
jgi:hypothetical protein